MHTRTGFLKSVVKPTRAVVSSSAARPNTYPDHTTGGQNPRPDTESPPTPSGTKSHTHVNNAGPPGGPADPGLPALPTGRPPPRPRPRPRPARRRPMRPSARRGQVAAGRPASLPPCLPACLPAGHAAALGAEGGCAPPQPGPPPGLQLLGAGALAAGLQPRGGREGERERARQLTAERARRPAPGPPCAPQLHPGASTPQPAAPGWAPCLGGRPCWGRWEAAPRRGSLPGQSRLPAPAPPCSADGLESGVGRPAPCAPPGCTWLEICVPGRGGEALLCLKLQIERVCVSAC